MLIFMLFGKFVLVLLYGVEYEPSVDILKIIAWYTIFSYLGVARNAWIVCTNTQKYRKYIYVGAAIASLLTQILTGMVLPCFIKQMRPNIQLMAEAFILKT